MPMPPRALLLHDIEEYMRTYITISNTADSNTARGGGSVLTLLQSIGFNYGARHSEVQLTAPLVHAYLSVNHAASNTAMFPFSRDTVRVDIGPNDGSGTGVPMYVIPYREGNARGVKLPSQVQDGFAEVFAITAAQDGCTFEIFGSQGSPYCSHSNCKDKLAGQRQAKMKDRVDKMHARFVAAEAALVPGYVQPPFPDGRTQFQHYGDDRAAPPDGAIRQLNYTTGAKIAVRSIADKTVKGGRVETGAFSHRRYWIKLTDQCKATTLGPQVGAGQVIGRRRNGVWQFYYQEHAPLYFDVIEVNKIGPKAETSRQAASGAHGRLADAILCSGKLWPEYSAETLALEDYA